MRRKQLKFTIEGGIFLCSHALSCLLYMPSHSPCKNLKNDLCILESTRFNAGTSYISPCREETHLTGGDCSRALEESNDEKTSDQGDESDGSNPSDDRLSMGLTLGEMVEMFLPGLVIHIVPEQQSTSLWRWTVQHKKDGFRALLANREEFKDIIVTPYMFLDHLPWR